MHCRQDESIFSMVNVASTSAGPMPALGWAADTEDRGYGIVPCAFPLNSRNPLLANPDTIVLSAASVLSNPRCRAGVGAVYARYRGTTFIISSTATKSPVLSGQSSVVPGRRRFPAWVTTIGLPATSPLAMGVALPRRPLLAGRITG